MTEGLTFFVSVGDLAIFRSSGRTSTAGELGRVGFAGRAAAFFGALGFALGFGREALACAPTGLACDWAALACGFPFDFFGIFAFFSGMMRALFYTIETGSAKESHCGLKTARTPVGEDFPDGRSH